MNARTRWLGLAAVSLALGGGLLGCSGSDSAGSGSAAVAPAGPAAGGAGSAVGTADSAAGAAEPAATAAGKADGSGNAQSAPDATSSVQIGPALIRTAELTVVVDDVPGRAAEAESAARAAGGVIAGDDRSGRGRDAHATLVLKVPPNRMDAVLDQLGRLGQEQSRTSSTQDVTEDVADIGSRVATMQASIARVRAILSRAEKIGDVVAVEGELSRRTTELESLQARQRALAGQVDYATITVQLRAKPVPAAAPPAPDRGGFVGGLQDGWHAFTAAVGWLLAVLGTLLPFLLVLVPIGLGVRWGLRRARPATDRLTAPAPQPE